MLPVRRTKLADDFWLAAHDSVGSKLHLGDWALGVGLAAGLFAELTHDGFLTLNDGELFRTYEAPTDDPALRPLLDKMLAEEAGWQQEKVEPVRAQVRAPARTRVGDDWPQSRDDMTWPAASPQGWRDWAGPAQDTRGLEESRHRLRGHQLRDWLSYLAYDGRAASRVTDRLSRSGLIKRVEHRRFLRGTTFSFEPCDANTAGTPATLITAAVRTRQPLDRSQLFFSGLLFATGLHHHALATLDIAERSQLIHKLKYGLDDASRELLRAADAAVGEAAMR